MGPCGVRTTVLRKVESAENGNSPAPLQTALRFGDRRGACNSKLVRVASGAGSSSHSPCPLHFQTMPRSGSADALLAIRGGTLLPPARSERHFQIPHRARSALRGAQAMLGMFLLFLLGLQDAKLLEDRTGAAGRAAWFAVGWSLAVVCWGAMLYLFPLCMKWPSVRVLVVEMLADASALLILGTNGFALLSGMGDACPILKSAACDRWASGVAPEAARADRPGQVQRVHGLLGH
ncbi:hypothetical protein DFJ74DRAFT_86197 [Hyaloraphidium curvatum]|nr:hypothetical protein DFJ74DRAFT_86197 [Hyaloraphidium curvatum]